MARGSKDIVACEMTKWFNTNYHYIVPEYEGIRLHVTNNYILDNFIEAKVETRYRGKANINWSIYICETFKRL